MFTVQICLPDFSVTVFLTLKSGDNSASGLFRNVIKENKEEHLLNFYIKM